MNSLDDVFEIWETLPDMAGDIGESAWSVAKWKQRNRIPQEHWPSVIDAVRRKGHSLSADDLLAMHAPRSRSQVAACE